MSRRVAVLMKLKAGVTKGEIKQLCDLLRKLGDPQWINVSQTLARFNKDLKPGARTDEQLVQVYDDEHGDPVFYVP